VAKVSRVFVVQEPKKWDHHRQELVDQFDLSPAERWGRIVILVPYGVRAQDSATVMEALTAGLSNFGDNDYLLPTGNPIIIGLATAIAADVNDGSVNFLRWSKTEGIHIPVSYSDIFDEGDQHGYG